MHTSRFVTLALALALSASLLNACGGDSADPPASDAVSNSVNNSANNDANNALPDGACLPNKEIWEGAVKAKVEENCGNCHGETPNFGAPYSLLDYDALVAGELGSRRVDRMAIRMADKTMPPPGDLVPHDDLDTMVLWASCGEQHPDHSIGLSSSAPIFEAPEESPEGMDFFDLKAGNFEVGENVLDLYQCFTFDVPVDEAHFIKRMEPVIDDARVLHHIVVLKDVNNDFEVGSDRCAGMPAGSLYLYAWAPGAGAIEFPEGGLRVEPGDRYVIQVHYNNGAGVPDAVDDSGMRFYIDEPEGPEYNMVAPGPINFTLPANAVTETTGTCRIRSDMTVLAGMPHMHEVGTEFHQTIIREDGTEELMIDLTGWSFELQYFYRFPVELKAGDKLLTTCVFDNKTDRRVESGARTQDEMCFNFMYVTPPQNFSYCDDVGGSDEEFAYTPGQCAPAEPLQDVTEFSGAVTTEPAPEFTGGPLTDGLYKLTGMTMYAPMNTPVGMPNTEESFILSAGQLEVAGDQIAMDSAFSAHLVLGTLEVDQPFDISIGGTLTTEGNVGTLATTCPGNGTTRFEFQADEGSVSILFRTNSGGIDLVNVLVFEKVE